MLEGLFNIPGVGQFLVISMRQNDVPAVQAAVLLIAVAVTASNFVVDVAYAWLDPRIRYA